MTQNGAGTINEKIPASLKLYLFLFSPFIHNTYK